ncbi:ABC transporter ATP-binding protein [Sporofaciens musculi]|uniref:ABC transporter ATP-binding protein n=1 Tax=Sporofaciens musculi TaxID=2681861 RepID=UPI002570B67F|nr:ABC transporter ATP-binding protein [Sporofaciens musculi]
MELEICGITKQYKDKCAVDQVSLTLTPGVWGLLGANGAGKTTLMRMIAGIQRPTSGCVRYDGIEIGTLKEAYRDIFGYLPQEFGFYPSFSIQDYLEYIAALKGLTKAESLKRIQILLERVSLSNVRNKKISKLSGGMKRRVVIAQALLNEPEVLVLDEPTSGLDPGERVKFRNLLSEFAHDRIVLISTHIVSDIEYIATCNAIMKEGKIIATGKTKELVQMVSGKVWSANIDSRELEEYEHRIPMVNVYNEENGDVKVRYLAETEVIPGSKSEEPRMEDLYLWLFPESGKED